MFAYLHDLFATISLRARYQRLVQERLLELTQEAGPQPVAEDPGRWHAVGDAARTLPQQERIDTRAKARDLVLHNPHARNVLRLLEGYVTGPGLKLEHRLVRREHAEPVQESHASRQKSAETVELLNSAEELWSEFLTTNGAHFSFREHARRAWRDGECFVRCFHQGHWPPVVRFVDPELIGACAEHPESQGIVTDPRDVETPVGYLRIDPATARLVESIPADEILHTRLGVDSNQKRGMTMFLPILETLDSFKKWMDTELLARKLQSSIVLWRKVQGSPQQAAALADGQSGSGMSTRPERLLPGTIITTNHATDIQFLQPQTNFGDAAPLGRMLLLAAAAGAGLPEFMLTSDASNGSFSSTMIAEGPAVKLFQSEQQFFAAEFTRLWRWIMREAVAAGLLPENFFARVEPHWSFPQLVNRDRPRERLTDVRLVETGVLSRAEVARRDGVDPTVMRVERSTELPARAT